MIGQGGGSLPFKSDRLALALLQVALVASVLELL